MSFSFDDAAELLRVPKKIACANGFQPTIQVRLGIANIQLDYDVVSENEEYMFKLSILQSPKYTIKISLHFQDDDSKIGLLRVDYGGIHTNPQIANDKVPNFIRPYAGKRFGYDDHHIHFHVDGYFPLNWAVPLTDDSFPVKEILDISSFELALIGFAKRVNIVTQLEFEERLFL